MQSALILPLVRTHSISTVITDYYTVATQTKKVVMFLLFSRLLVFLMLFCSSIAFPRTSRCAYRRKSTATTAGTVSILLNRRLMSQTHPELSALNQKEKDKIVADMLYRVRQCNIVPVDVRDKLVNFVVDGRILGKPRLELAKRLDATPYFSFNSGILSLTEKAGTSRLERTEKIHEVMLQLKKEGVITGWRDELLSVAPGFYDEPIFLIERAAAPLFGTQAYGVHINGYVRDEAGRLKLWVARRSKTKSKYPAMLDHIAAGGQPFGIAPMQNVIKECGEEAGIPSHLAKSAIPVSAISYEYSAKNGMAMERACLFCYDLELPREFLPKAVDGEVDEFFLWSLDKVAATMSPDFHDPYKPNCYLVIIDFMLRHGYISPESPGYLDLLRELRSGQCA